MKKKILFVAACISGSALFAQDSSKTLNEVIITANKFLQKQSTTGKVVTVIGKEVLEKSSGKTVSQLLNEQTGFTIIGAQNTLGSNQDIYMRGASTGQTLILIDGIPAYDASTISPAFDINNFAIDNIERIEIVKGAQSTLYGSDAVAGVINIITKKAGTKPVSIFATISGGSYNTFKGAAGVNGTIHNSQYNLQYSHLQSGGFSSAYDSAGNKNFDNDGFNQNILSGYFNTYLAKSLLWKINGQIGKYKTDLDASAYTDDKDYTVETKNYQAGTGLQYKYNKGNLTFNYNLNITKRNYLDDSTDVGGFAKYTAQQYTGTSNFLELYNNISLCKHIDLLTGVDYRFQNSDQHYFSISSFGPYETTLNKDSARANIYSLYASAFLKELGSFHFEIGGRYNKHSKYGSNFTYTINPSYLINTTLKIFTNLSSGFKAPSLYQLFDLSVGVPTLAPEKSVSIDGGLEYNSINKTLFARAVYFHRFIKNGIDYSFQTNKYFNYNRQNDNGIELEGKFSISKFSIGANYTYITGKVKTLKYIYDSSTYSYVANGDILYNNLFRRPKNTLKITLAFTPLSNWYISAQARIAGKRYEPVFMDKSTVLESYQIINLYSEYNFNKKIKVFADVKNLTNKKFFDISGYNSYKLNLMAGIICNF